MNATHSSSWRAFTSLHFSKEHPYPLLSLTNPVKDVNKHNAASSFRYNTEPPTETPNMNVWQIHHRLDHPQTKQTFVMCVAKAGDICSMSTMSASEIAEDIMTA